MNPGRLLRVLGKIGNLQKITIRQYKTKLLRNRYPLVRSEQEVENLDVMKQILFKRHDSPSPYSLNLEQKLVLLDFFNTQFSPCHYCNIPYSYGGRTFGEEEFQLCMPCYVITNPKPLHFYVSEENDVHYVSTLLQSVAIPDLNVLFELTQEEELMDFIRTELERQESTDSSLDEFF
ncbi:MAG: hypothetical protein ACXAE3_16435 [Candidatus Kariarchaeaceae archaeon]|jgi:hypothetical protein